MSGMLAQVDPSEMQGWIDLLNGRNFATVFFLFCMYVVWKHGSQITAFLKASTDNNKATGEFIKASTANNQAASEQMKAIGDSVMGLVDTSHKSQTNHEKTHAGIQMGIQVAYEACEAARKAIGHTNDPELQRKVLPHIDAIERLIANRN